MNVWITINHEPHDCGMCGPSGRRVCHVRIDEPKVKETFRQSYCDNSDPWNEESLLRYALERIGYNVEISGEA